MPRLIDADALIKWCIYCADDDIVRVNRQVMIYMLEHAPTVDAEPVRHGRWVNHISENGATDGTYCGICDYEVDRDARYNYCPNCGAKMGEVEDDKID